MRGDKRSVGQLGCAAALGMAIALPVGIALGRHWFDEPVAQAGRIDPVDNGSMPNLFSPKVLSDPAVKKEHERIAEALELACATQRLHCKEAASARQSLERRSGR